MIEIFRLKNLWFFWGHINLTLVIIALMVVDLVAGYRPLKYYPELFAPINDMGFQIWCTTYGFNCLDQTLWLFILVGLLVCLSINTFVCTTQRMVRLIKYRKSFQSQFQFFLRLSPHIIHYSMLVMFCGYLISYLGTGTHMGKVLLPGRSITLVSPACTITLKSLDIDYYHGERMPHMERRAISARAFLEINDGKRQKSAVLAYNSPVYFAPISIHLKDFAPETKGGMSRRKYIHVIIKNDPGKYYYSLGMMFFTLGMFMYLLEKGVKNWNLKHSENENNNHRPGLSVHGQESR